MSPPLRPGADPQRVRVRVALTTVLSLSTVASTTARADDPATPAGTVTAASPNPSVARDRDGAASARAQGAITAPPEASSAAPARRDAAVDVRARSAGTLLRLTLPGEWQVRGVALTELPLATTPGEREPRTLGQQSFFEQWFRFRPEFSVGDSFRLVGQFDVARGILFGESTRQVSLSRDARNTDLSPFYVGVIDLRELYLDWQSPIGVLRAGQMGSHWGMGIVANDGDHPQTFGDYRMGDLVERIAFATRPGGRTSNVVLAVAGDLVYRDRLARLVEYRVAVDGYPTGPDGVPGSRPIGNDRAWQAVASVFYQRHDCRGVECDRKRLGVYAVYRDQHNRVGDASYADDFLRVGVLDAHARWEWPSPDGRANVWAAAEVAGIVGRTTITRTVQVAEQDVLQLGASFEVGIYRTNAYRFALEGGYASGDANPLDSVQTRFTFNPDHRVGLLLFPELMAWQTARSASIAIDPRLVGRATRGAELLPSSGGVTNAMYLYPTAVIDLHRLIDLRAGAVIAQSTSDLVDPVQAVSYGAARNYRGGDARFRDLGLELDLGVQARIPIAAGITLVGGAQGAVLFPGRAFADGAGNALGVQALAQGRAGLTF